MSEKSRRVGWWVVFDEPDDDGTTPAGFFVDEQRAVNFHLEPGFKRNHLEPVFLWL